MTELDNRTRGARPGARPGVVIAASALAAMALVGAVVVWQGFFAACGGWFSALATTGTGECVGVLAAGDRLGDPEVDGLIARFDAANDAVAEAGGAYVKIVLLSPLSVPADGTPAAMSPAQVRSSLQGSFTAMDRANATAAFGSPNAPRLQVVLANQGSRQEYSPALVDDIVGAGEPDHPVVAVVGLGSSFPGTTATATALSQRGIPMVSAVASADDIDARAVPGLRSVSPSNTEYARALRSYLDAQTELRSGAIVADQNTDSYTSTLRAAFRSELGRYVHFSELPFNGSTADSGGATPQVFAPVVTNLCVAANDPDPANRLDTVFYAGRVADFRGFVTALGSRICRNDRPLAVLVGATGFDAVRGYQREIEDANLTVVYASSADADFWAKGGPGAPQGFPAFRERFRALAFPDEALGDGYAIMYHDALAGAAVAVRLAAQGGPVPGPATVRTQFGNVAGAYAVPGASGTLSFLPEKSPPESDGRALGKLVPLRQVGRNTPVLLEAGCVFVVGGPCVPA